MVILAFIFCGPLGLLVLLWDPKKDANWLFIIAAVGVGRGNLGGSSTAGLGLLAELQES